MTDISQLSTEELQALLAKPDIGKVPTAQLQSMLGGSPSGSFWQNLPAAIGMGASDAIMGGAQTIAHSPPFAAGGAIAKALGAQGDPVAQLDQAVKDKEEIDKALKASPGGTTGSIIGNLITAPLTPGSSAAKGASVLQKLGNAAMQGGKAGLVQGAFQPVTDDDYASGKLKQEAAATAGGSILGPILNGAGQIGETLLPANAAKTLVNFLNSRGANSAKAAEGERLAAQTGVNLTPAQISADPGANMAENMARQSIFSRSIAAEGDRARVQQLSDYFDRTLQGVSASEASPAIAGKQVQTAAQNLIKGLQDWRSKTAAEDFGAIRALTKGQAAIEPENTNALLQDIFSKADGVGTPEADALARFAKKQLSNVNPQAKAAAAEPPAGILDARGNPISTQPAAQAQAAATAPAQGNLDKLMELRSYLSSVAGGQQKISGQPIDRSIAAQLLGSIDQDIEAAGDKIGGDLGGMLKQANARYREVSQQIDSVKSSPLGKILGDDVVGAFQSGSFNTIAPETVMQRLNALKPTELGVVRGLLEQDQPQAWSAFKRSMLETALDNAKQIPASMGANAPVMIPSKLVSGLDMKKLSAVFNPDELSQINAGLGVARRLADKTGYNFSETGPAGEALGFMNGLKDFGLKTAASLGGQVLGTRALARVMTDADGRMKLMQLGRLSDLGSDRARQLTAQIAAIAAAGEADGMGNGSQ